LQNINSKYLILGWQNLTNLKFCTVQYFRCHNLSFLCSTKYKSVYFFQIFLSQQNVVYSFLK
jgi:hypothetical protein